MHIKEQVGKQKGRTDLNRALTRVKPFKLRKLVCAFFCLLSAAPPRDAEGGGMPSSSC